MPSLSCKACLWSMLQEQTEGLFYAVAFCFECQWPPQATLIAACWPLRSTLRPGRSDLGAPQVVAARRASTAHISARKFQACTKYCCWWNVILMHISVRQLVETNCAFILFFPPRIQCRCVFFCNHFTVCSHLICIFSCFSFLYKNEKRNTKYL